MNASFLPLASEPEGPNIFQQILESGPLVSGLYLVFLLSVVGLPIALWRSYRNPWKMLCFAVLPLGVATLISYFQMMIFLQFEPAFRAGNTEWGGGFAFDRVRTFAIPLHLGLATSITGAVICFIVWLITRVRGVETEDLDSDES